MCGRYSLSLSSSDLSDYFHLVKAPPPLEPRYNIAPSQDVAVIREKEEERLLVMLHWGLIPFWANDTKIGYRTLNARSETAYKTPAFRAAFRSRRCLIPASGYFEWDKKDGTRQPYFIFRADGQPIAFAGLWEHWEEKEGKEVIDSCTILTTEASEPVANLHDRMPVILEPEDFDQWLDPHEQDVDHLRKLLRPAPPGILSMYPVSKYVNKATHEGQECVEPVEEKG